jgi:predicted MPP superfamily phosphohydrolase
MLTNLGINTCLSGHAHEAAIEWSRIGKLARGNIFTFLALVFIQYMRMALVLVGPQLF